MLFYEGGVNSELPPTPVAFISFQRPWQLGFNALVHSCQILYAINKYPYIVTCSLLHGAELAFYATVHFHQTRSNLVFRKPNSGFTQRYNLVLSCLVFREPNSGFTQRYIHVKSVSARFTSRDESFVATRSRSLQVKTKETRNYPTF